jgi:hypothetical protein
LWWDCVIRHGTKSNRRNIVSNAGNEEEQPLGKPKDDGQTGNPNTEPENDRPITEDPDGTPVENPSGG